MKHSICHKSQLPKESQSNASSVFACRSACLKTDSVTIMSLPEQLLEEAKVNVRILQQSFSAPAEVTNWRVGEIHLPVDCSITGTLNNHIFGDTMFYPLPIMKLMSCLALTLAFVSVSPVPLLSPVSIDCRANEFSVGHLQRCTRRWTSRLSRQNPYLCAFCIQQ